MKDNKHSIWLPLLGFDRDKPDLGVNDYMEQIGFLPECIFLFLCHPDVIQQHPGMETEFTFPIDFCSYYGAPCNNFRERQPWTNYEVRDLVSLLAEKGVDVHVAIFGDFLENSRHKEWQDDHRELLSFGVNGRMNLNVLKRFKDGRYYEDFFIEKALETFDDYGFAGLHVSDFFCPPEHSICNGDFSADMLEQFASYNQNIKYPEEITARLCFDEQEDIEMRQKYIWGELRKEWIDFYSYRWEKFWNKVSDAFHKKGKKIFVNNAWTADPFEAIYRYGIDYKRLYSAGVDCFIAETSPEGLELLDGVGDVFRKLMASLQLMSVYSPGKPLQNLLGVKDCTEEWDLIHHQPPRMERDMYLSGALFRQVGNQYFNSSNGYMVTLGDGITREEWDWLGEREEVSFSLKPKKIEAATLIWSDNELHKSIDEYIKTRRASSHTLMYKMQDNAIAIGAVARIEDIEGLDNVLFVPSFDLLPDDEKRLVLSYKKAPVICIASKDYIDSTDIQFDFCFEDKYANYKLCAFILNSSLTEDEKAQITGCFENGEYVIDPQGEPLSWYDPPFFTTPMPFAGISDSFFKACKLLFDFTDTALIHCEHPILSMQVEDNVYRVYVFNPSDIYLRAKVYAKKPVLEVKNVSKYPVLPVKLIAPVKVKGLGDGLKVELMQIVDPDAKAEGFYAKVPPHGISIFDVVLE